MLVNMLPRTKQVKCREDQIDRLKSSFGIGNKGRLMKKKKSKLEKDKERLRESWRQRFKIDEK